jgi:hypothetical protein
LVILDDLLVILEDLSVGVDVLLVILDDLLVILEDLSVGIDVLLVILEDLLVGTDHLQEVLRGDYLLHALILWINMHKNIMDDKFRSSHLNS